MKKLILILITINGTHFSPCQAQVIDSTSSKFESYSITRSNLNEKASLFPGGAMGLSNTGQLSACARLYKIFIGRPGGPRLPITIASGVNTASARINNTETALSLISNWPGIIHIYGEWTWMHNKELPGIIDLLFYLQSGWRILQLINKSNLETSNLPNWYWTLGPMLVTNAWERMNSKSIGLFWVNLQGIFARAPGYMLSEIFGNDFNNNLFGMGICMGIDINKAINARVNWYRYFTNNHIRGFEMPLVQAGFLYSR